MSNEIITDYPGGICYFCCKEAKEEYFSGSYETYLNCDCEPRKAWSKAHRLASDLAQVARNNKKQMDKEVKIRELRAQLKDLER